jgi:hypothetical protein
MPKHPPKPTGDEKIAPVEEVKEEKIKEEKIKDD